MGPVPQCWDRCNLGDERIGNGWRDRPVVGTREEDDR